MTLLKWIIAGILVVSATACNTIEGVGEDVQAGGQKLEEAAERQKRKD